MLCCFTSLTDYSFDIDKSSQYQLTLQSDLHHSQKVLRINKSLYDQYLQGCANIPFTDPQFPPNNSSLQFSVQGRAITWRRITDIIPNATIFQGPIEDCNIQSGNLGDKYFFPTISVIAKHPNRIKNIFHLTTKIQKSCIYRLIVKQSGVLKELVIDDYIPVFSDSQRPIFSKTYGCQIWPILLQKAWAKLKGSYNAIFSGCPHEVFATFCIGPCKTVSIQDNNKILINNLWKDLKYACKNNFIICATSSINSQSIGLPSEKMVRVLNITDNNSKQTITFDTNNKEQIRMVQMQSKKLQSIVFSPKSIQSSKTVQNNNTINFNNFINSFQRVDFSYDNDNFSYEFKQIKAKTNQPIFFQFQVQEDHQAFIQINKALKSKAKGKIGLILASQRQDEQEKYFQFQQGNIERQFEDCFIHIQNLSIDKHVLLIYSNQQHPSEEAIIMTLGYSFKNISRGSRTSISKLDPNPQFYFQFMKSVLLSHHCKSIASNIMEEHSIRCVDLFSQIGLGYIFCRVQPKAKFRLQIAINTNEIIKSGINLMGNWRSKSILSAGNNAMLIFQLIPDSAQIVFPPPLGCKITKII